MKFFFALILYVTSSHIKEWKRKTCGWVGSDSDQITKWGASLDPENVLPEYPRPQMRRATSWINLNGIWEFEPTEEIKLGQTLESSILVPFPVESCLSGIKENHQHLLYRKTFTKPFKSGNTILHFGAVDWQTQVYLNQQFVGNHTGGYDGFSFDITEMLAASGDNELVVKVYDPSESGYQVNGKQYASRIEKPGGDTYTPASGIWQTVWLEQVPVMYIHSLNIVTDMKALTLTVNVPGAVILKATAEIAYNKSMVQTFNISVNSPSRMEISGPQLWDFNNPHLYHLEVTLNSGDKVYSYFGLRSISKVIDDYKMDAIGPLEGVDMPGNDLGNSITLQDGAIASDCKKLCDQKGPSCVAWSFGKANCDVIISKPTCWLKSAIGSYTLNKCRTIGQQAIAAKVLRPALNGKPFFASGWLDQSFWPDGIYTAPTDEALKYDLEAVKMFGFNSVRLHQKVNSERWYYWADRLGILIWQDMPQKYGGSSKETVPGFYQDLKAMIVGRGNHPSIFQWTAFNEGDCWKSFNITDVTRTIHELDSSRLIDTNSGGGANDMHIWDLNDIHTYPWPRTPDPSSTQYAAIGEYGGLGAFVKGKEWAPGQCHTYLKCDTTSEEHDQFVFMLKLLQMQKWKLSASIYTQITDVENECDGFLNYDRTNKFTEEQTASIKNLNSL